ncbi:plexin-D1 [Betta splendens]|uniref:Plexin-D1 n=1 Tax=Betta splendens TaxID=158456 RepID=A0A6P7N273_BETSP|nr:plexin-D1 [Betta splendens]
MPPSIEIAVLLLGVLALETRWSARALLIQQSFASPNQTNNFVVDSVSGKVYLATVNAIYQLNGSLSVEVEKRTGPVEDNLLCHAPQLPQAPCEHPKALTDNYNKLLKLDRQQGVVVACGSVYQGFCELRKMDNISEIAVEFPPQGEKTVFPSMLNIAANHPNASTVGLVFRSHGGNTRLLVAATYTGAGTQFFPKNHSKEDLRFENTPEIAIRSLNINDLSRLFTYDINPSEDNVFKIKQEVKTKNKLNFVHAFIQKTYSYIAFNNDAKMGHKESQPNSILARICLDTENPRRSPPGPDSRKLTESFIQMPLQCGFNGNIYNRLVSVYPAEIHAGDGGSSGHYLFGVFAKADRSSALCAFKFGDIEEEIRQGRRNCSNSPSSDVQVLDSVIQGSGAACIHKGNLVLQPEQLDCGAAHLQHPLALRRPLRATPVCEYPGLSSVSVDNVHNHTVVFLGTSNGRLRKLTLLTNMTLAGQQTLKLPASEPVHHIMTFDPSDRNFLYLMTSHHMLRVKVAECDQWRSCSECLGAGDAHCGWCTLENRCSVQDECAEGLRARSWISLGEGPLQCPSMTLTPPEISISADIKDVGILINGSVPDLVGSRVECEYGPGVSTAATVHLDYGSAQIQTCPLLPRHSYRPILPGADHLSVSLAIKVNGTSVVSGSFVIYDCERTGAIHPKTATSERELPVTVQVGNFHHTIAKVQLGGSELAIVVSIVVCCVLLLLCTVALVVYCTKSRRAERYWQKTLLQMEEMESQIREEIRKGFAELQTDMTDLTKELNRSQGIPFLEYKQFVTRTFFPKMCSDYEKSLVQPVYENHALGPRALPETHPLLQDWQATDSTRPNVEEGITLFSTLLSNKHFLITFVHALEQQKDFAVRDRCSLASLLTIALHGKLEYYTSIMKDLLVDLIDASASKNPKLMLRRTESVVEKMLTNWMSICMYSYLKETVGEPFFLLLCAIKQQINKGSIDAITGKARYTLNEEWLLRENIEAKPQNINVSFQGCGMDSLSVRVMNTDTICQVKEKIIEAFYKNLPFSQWPRAEDVDLEWFDSGSNSKLLQDLDNSSVMEDGRKKLNTVFHYLVPEGASLAMSMKDRKENSLGRVKDLDTEKYVHLVLPHDELMETNRTHRQSHRKKVLPEIYLTRLLSTKGTLQKFLDDLFQAILSIPPDCPPLAVKYFFDFLEEQADKRGITDPDTLHIWKTNSLPLRFWVNILKNPQFVFDIDKTDHMDACLSVIAQAFIDACSISDLQLGKDSPTNKLLYAKEIPEYKKRVQCYYRQIQEMPPLSEQEMNAHLAEESRKYRNEFNTTLALTEIYKYAKRYRNQVVNALESNPTARRTQLHHKFEQVIALVEDNIYECCSEA